MIVHLSGVRRSKGPNWQLQVLPAILIALPGLLTVAPDFERLSHYVVDHGEFAHVVKRERSDSGAHSSGIARD